MTVTFYVHDPVVIFWCPRQYAPTMELDVLVALGFALGTRWACGLGLCPRDLLCSWPRPSLLGLAALVDLGFALGICFAHEAFFLYYTNYPTPLPNATLSIGAAAHNPNYWGSRMQP